MSKRLAKAVLLEFNYYKNANKVVDPKQELIESEANAKSFLKLLYSKMVNRTTLKVIIIIIKISFLKLKFLFLIQVEFDIFNINDRSGTTTKKASQLSFIRQSWAISNREYIIYESKRID